MARVTAYSKKQPGWSYTPTVDPLTGILGIAAQRVYKGITSVAEARDKDLVGSFGLQILKEKSDGRTIVTQRLRGNLYGKVAINSSYP